MEIIEKLQRKRPEIVHLFDEIVKTVPEGIYLTAIKQTGNKLEIHGVAQSSTRVSTFMRNIDSSVWMDNPVLQVVESAKDSPTGGSNFTLTSDVVGVDLEQRRRNNGQEGCGEMNFVDQLRTLDPRDVGRWPLPVRGFFIALIFAVVAAFGWYMFVWNDDRPLLQKAQADELDLRSQFENKQQRAANLDAYRAQLAEMERSFGAMLRQLPGKTEVPNLLVDISQTGLAAGLQEKLFQPGSEKSNGFYAELPIKIKLVGSYHDFGNFVSGIAALPRIVTLHDIQITPVDAKGGYDNLTMDVTAKTYRYIEDEGGAQTGQERRREARRETICASIERHRRRPCRPGRGRLFRRPVGSAEVDRRHQEKARRTHTGAAGSEALRNLRVQRRQYALAVPAAGRGRRPGLLDDRARGATASSSRIFRSTL